MFRFFDILDLNEIGVFLVIKLYFIYSLDEDMDEDKVVERLLMWVVEEVLVVL